MRRSRDLTSLLTFVDYGLSSVTNFATTLVVLRNGSQHELGIFAVIYAAYLLALGVTRAAISDAHLMDRARAKGNDLSLAAAQVASVSVLASVVALPFALSLAGPSRNMLLTLCAATPGLMLFDLLRYREFGRGRPGSAVRLDAAWLAAVTVAVAVLVAKHDLTVSWMFAIWAFTGSAIGLVFGLGAALSGRTTGLSALLNDRSRRAYLTLEYLASGGASNASSFVIAAMAGLPASGLIRAGQTVVAPVNIVQQSAEPTLISRAAARDRKGHSVIGLLVAPCMLVVTVTMVFTSALMLVPTKSMEQLLGPNWTSIRPIVPWLAIFVMAESLVTGSRALFRGLGEYRATLHVRLITAPISLVSVAIGAAAGGATGAASAIGLSSCLSSVLWLSALRAHLRQGPRPQAPGRLSSTALRPAIWVAMTLIPRSKNSAVFHSYPDLDDSVLAMLEALPPSVKATVLLDGPTTRSVPNARLLRKRGAAGRWAYLRSSLIFFTHGLFASPDLSGTRRTVISLWHGDVGKLGGRWLEERPHWSTYTVVGSRLSAAFRVAETGAHPRRALVTGNPRNDRLISALGRRAELRQALGFDPSEKVALWLPTYRVSVASGRLADGTSEEFAIPPLAFDADLARIGWRMLVKAHPLSSINTQFADSANIQLIDDVWIQETGLSFYELLSVGDALVTDYSSVWIDFLLCDRPVIYYCPDLQEYEESRGLLLEPYDAWVPGPLVHDLPSLALALSSGDVYQAERLNACTRFHQYRDSANAARLWGTLRG